MHPIQGKRARRATKRPRACTLEESARPAQPSRAFGRQPAALASPRPASHPDRENPRARRRTDPQPRHHRPHRSRQDDADRQHLPRRSRVPRERARGRARDGQQRPRARARDHHPLQALHRGVEGLPHQHHRHPRPRRFQRRGRARAQHGGLGAPPGGRQRGSHAADALRAHARAGVRAAAHRDRQQGRPAQRGPVRRPGQDLRPLRRAGRQQRAARLPRPLRLGPRRLDRQRSRRVPEGRARTRSPPRRRRDALAGAAQGTGRRRHERSLRDDHRQRPRAAGRPGGAVPHAGEHARLERLHRPHRLRTRARRLPQGRRRCAAHHDAPPRGRRPGRRLGVHRRDARAGHAPVGDPRAREP